MNAILNNPLVQLAVAVVMVLFAVMEVRACARAFRQVRQRRAAGSSYPELPLVRPLSFLHNCAAYADAALVTLIAMDMLAGSPLSNNALVLALPLTATYLAYLLSGPLRMAIVGRSSLRTGMLIGSGGTLACFALVALSIVAGSFWAYVATLFVCRCFYYLLVSCVRLMPAVAKSERERIDANTENANADVSASALMGLAAGFAAQYLGDVWVYVIAMVPSLVLTLLIWRLVPRDMAAAERTDPHAKARAVSKRVLAFLLQPSMIALLFFALVTLGFSGCYRSYLFPMFASYDGLDKAAVSTLMVFCSALVFYLAPPLTRLAHRIGPRRLLVSALVVCACAFLGFLVRGSIEWAVIALFLTQIIKKVGEPCAQTLWPHVADNVGISRSEGQAVYEVLDGIVCIAKTPVMGMLLTLGQAAVCVIVGIYGIISAAGFWITTRSGPFAR